jgi:hypothetical protein
MTLEVAVLLAASAALWQIIEQAGTEPDGGAELTPAAPERTRCRCSAASTAARQGRVRGRGRHVFGERGRSSRVGLELEYACPSSSTTMTATNAPLIAAARSQMTASSPRVTFSPPELTADRVITRCITRPMSVPGATIRAMPGDLEPLPALVYPVAPGAGPAAVAGELLGRIRAELPVVGELGTGTRS